MSLDSLLHPWSGATYRHIPNGSPHGLLDLRFTGRGGDNRWNHLSEPTLYLASDAAVALAEFARHMRIDRLALAPRERSLFQLDVALDAVLDLRDPQVHAALSITNPPTCFLDKGIARAVAELIRRSTSVTAIVVPSVAFLDDRDRWNLVLFLEKLPTNPNEFIRSVQARGTFTVAARVAPPEHPRTSGPTNGELVASRRPLHFRLPSRRSCKNSLQVAASAISPSAY